jgi:hypothetical protein
MLEGTARNRRRASRTGLLAALVCLCGTALLFAADRTAQDTIPDWPAKPKEAAQAMIAKYGQPDGVTPQQLIWYDKAPWKEIIVNRREVPHSFPKPHTDLLEQAIEHRVPPEKYDDLAQYDGSVIVERTKGTLSARCDKEEMNFLALNLAHDVATGKATVAAARKTYADTAMAFMKGEKRPYTQKLQFEIAKGNAGDPDQPAAMDKK